MNVTSIAKTTAAALLIPGFALTLTSCQKIEKISKHYDVDGAIENISINTTSHKVTFNKATDGKFSVDFKGMEIKAPDKVANDNGTLVITTPKNSGMVGFNIGVQNDDNITINLPENAFKRLDVDSTSGWIEVPSDYTFDNAKIKLTSGIVNFDGDVKDKFDLTVSSGDIKINTVNAKDANVKCTSGRINMKNCNYEGDLTIDYTSGSITLENVISNTLNSKGSSGRFILEKCDAKDITLSLTSGAVNGTLLTGKDFDIARKTSGVVNVPSDNPEGGKCTIDVTSGAVNLSVAE